MAPVMRSVRLHHIVPEEVSKRSAPPRGLLGAHVGQPRPDRFSLIDREIRHGRAGAISTLDRDLANDGYFCLPRDDFRRPWKPRINRNGAVLSLHYTGSWSS
jgi:hypothetical protein